MPFPFRPPGPRKPAPPRRRCRPQVEALAERFLPSFTHAPDVPVGDAPRSVAVGDFNGDGKPDLAAANAHNNTVSIRLGDGAGGFAAVPDVAVGDHPFSVAVTDFNGDGRPDLAAANLLSDSVSIRLGN